MDSFTKKATNVGGCFVKLSIILGFVIPYEIAYKEGIKKGTMVRVILEKVELTQESGLNELCGLLSPDLSFSSFTSETAFVAA